ncbi:hypothetical protein LLG95_07780 [bacterium]|nr:hypothetical protein [bacterium]
MDAELGSGSRFLPRWWVVLLALVSMIPAVQAGPGTAQKREAPSPFQCWMRILSNPTAAETIAVDAVLKCVDFADPGTLQVPTQASIGSRPAPAKPQPAGLSSEKVNQVIGTAGCMLLPSWRLRLTTLSLMAHS